MVKRESGRWGLKAAVCAAIVVWQIYEMAVASVHASFDVGYASYLIIGLALVGLIASLLKLVTET